MPPNARQSSGFGQPEQRRLGLAASVRQGSQRNLWPRACRTTLLAHEIASAGQGNAARQPPATEGGRRESRIAFRCRPAGHSATAAVSSAVANGEPVGEERVRDDVIGPPSQPRAEHDL